MNEIACISVIVPIYNTEKYLDACIASIANQSHTALQIILVDDGSQDASGAICDAWAGKDKRIQVIHQKNAGVSTARNAGLDIAEGELISFVDSDDVLPPDAYEKLLGSMGKKDVVMGRMKLMQENNMLVGCNRPIPPAEFSLDEFVEELFAERRLCYLGYLWDKLFKHNIIQNNSIRFDPTIKLNEDRLFLLEYLIHCSSISFCPALVYFYRQRSSGVIISTRGNQTISDNEMTVIDSFIKMSGIAKMHSERLYYLIARKSFESALDLLSRVAKTDSEKIGRIRYFKRESARICLQTPGTALFEKVKIIIHCILEQ